MFFQLIKLKSGGWWLAPVDKTLFNCLWKVLPDPNVLQLQISEKDFKFSLAFYKPILTAQQQLSFFEWQHFLPDSLDQENPNCSDNLCKGWDNMRGAVCHPSNRGKRGLLLEPSAEDPGMQQLGGMFAAETTGKNLMLFSRLWNPLLTDPSLSQTHTHLV